MINVSFVIEGDPVPKGRPRIFRGRGVTPEKTATYEAKGRREATVAMNGSPPTNQYVSVDILAVMAIPKSFSQKKREEAICGIIRPVGRADIDNIAKSALDCMNGIVFDDDNQVVDLKAKKVYGPIPKMIIRVSET